MPGVMKLASTSQKTKKRKSKTLSAAEAAHNKWLRKNGVHPDQLRASKKNSMKNQ